MTINVDHPIHKVQVLYGNVVRALSLWSKKSSNQATPHRLMASSSLTSGLTVASSISIMEQGRHAQTSTWRGRILLWSVCLYAVPFIVTLLTKCKAHEKIFAISGKAGNHPGFGDRVCQISFVIYDTSTGKSRITGVSFMSWSRDPCSQFLIS